MERDKSTKKNNKHVDAILILLIVVIIIAVITLGVVLIISFKHPEENTPDKNPGLVTDTKESYQKHLESMLEDDEVKEIPLTDAATDNTHVVLGTDNLVYLVKNTDNQDDIPGASGTVTKGNKYEGITNVVDIMSVKTVDSFGVYALTSDGTLYILDINNNTASSSITHSYNCNGDVIDVYSQLNELYVKLYDQTSAKFGEVC